MNALAKQGKLAKWHKAIVDAESAANESPAVNAKSTSRATIAYKTY
jgi:hypothetical protein